MADTPNQALVRRGYEAFNAADIDTLGPMFADDAIHVIPGDNQISGEHQGRDTVLGVYGRIGELTAGNFTADLTSLEDLGDGRVRATHRHRGSRPDGRTVDIEEQIVFTIQDGKFARLESSFADTAAEDAFWA
jgi:ketosteroid isomerase-like protein